jgi:glycosyltransferase involved in cell wall biosynthesis
MNKINISILTITDFPYGGAGENFIRQIALGLNHHKVNVEVIRFKGNRSSNVNDTPIKCTNYLFKKPFKNELLIFLELFFHILYIPFFIMYRKLIKRDEAILINGIDRMYFVLPFTLFCKLFNIKCYRIIAEIFPDKMITPFWWRKPIALFYKWQMKYFDRYLNGVVVLSSYLYKLCIKNGVKSERLILIPHFINLNVKVTNSIDYSTFRIGFCGIPSVENGIIDLLNAFKIISILHKKTDVELVIMGEMSKSVNDIIEQQNLLAPNIYFTGFLKKNDVEKELACCTILVNPRKSGILADSGFPTKLGEYFALKKPVVSTKVGDLLLYFTNKDELVFAEPDSPESLAESILYLYNNKENMNLIGLSGYNWAAENLDYIANTKKLTDFVLTT